MRIEKMAEGVTLYCGDMLEILPTAGPVDHIIQDPPYEAVMQDKWGVLSRNTPSSHVRHESIGFAAIDDVRTKVAQAMQDACVGWSVSFCMAEGVRAWRDAIEASGARYKRAMVWIKPDAMPQFNGQGPSVGFEMMVSAWHGKGYSVWNGGGRPGTFTHVKKYRWGSEHPTQKPLPLITELVQLFTMQDQIVCDPFMGSGTTGVAAIQLGRKFVGIEVDEKHFDLSCRRIEQTLKFPNMFADVPKDIRKLALPNTMFRFR